MERCQEKTGKMKIPVIWMDTKEFIEYEANQVAAFSKVVKEMGY